MFVVRPAAERDLSDLERLASRFDTVNLPNDRAALAALIEASCLSFEDRIPATDRQYVFVLEDVATARVIGTSAVHAQHGSKRAPHVYFDVLAEERYSESLDLHVRNRIMRIGYAFDGPTEIGGLVLDPDYRQHPERLGRTLSFVRFLFIAARRSLFRPLVLAELLPPLEPDGSSRLWSCLGEGFTGMTYRQADRLSQTNKEFIRALFPQGAIYTSLLPPDVQRLIGEVGPSTKGVERMLQSIGFVYANRIDPFDGGPHYVAETDAITLVRDTRPLRVAARAGEGTCEGLVGCSRGGFRACRSTYEHDGEDVRLPERARAQLGVGEGELVWVQSLPGRTGDGTRPGASLHARESTDSLPDRRRATSWRGPRSSKPV